ncbi:MAG TPA: hypothetical protein VK636_06645 [Gemmatimonadaceae bacterium]|nr:hypothetical protein [Gemmatimonadaceae bacterium]
MRQCARCAENNQDADAFCRLCGNDLGAVTSDAQLDAALAAPATVDAPPRKKASIVGWLALALFAAIPAVLAGSRPARTVIERGARQIVFRRPQMQIVSIASASEMEIGSGKLARFDWTVPVEQPHCHLMGHIEVLSGGTKDVQVFLVSADDYSNLARGHPAKTYLTSAKTTAVDLNVQLNTPGPMTLVIGNTFAPLTTKRVQLRDVKATCS